MERTVVTTTHAPAAIGPYSQAIRLGDFLFCSGQIPLDPATGQLVGKDIQSQTEQCLSNISGLLASQGLNLAHVVKTTVFLKNMGEFAAFNEVYASYFRSSAPARSTVEVSALPKGALVEIEAIAYFPR